MKRLTVALAQIDLALGEPEENLARVRLHVGKAKDQGADLLVFPELWSSAYDLEHAARYATPCDRGMFAEVAGLAREYGIAIAGSLLESDAERIYNTATLVDSRGELLGSYRKLHLVPMLDEDRFLNSGDTVQVVEAPFGKCALAICYDLRFPELWRHYTVQGAEMVILPSEFPVARLAHWRTLLPARAIENQIFVAATNRVGTSKGQTFGGHSMVVDPWGNILAEAGDQEELLIAHIEPDALIQARERVPALRDRRPDLYARW